MMGPTFEQLRFHAFEISMVIPPRPYGSKLNFVLDYKSIIKIKSIFF